MHGIDAAAPPAVDRIALDLRACRAVTHAALQVAEVADLELDEPRPLIDAEAGSRPVLGDILQRGWLPADRLQPGVGPVALSARRLALIADLACGDALALEHSAADIAHVRRVPDLVHCMDVERHGGPMLAHEIMRDAAGPRCTFGPDTKVLKRQRAKRFRHWEGLSRPRRLPFNTRQEPT